MSQISSTQLSNQCHFIHDNIATNVQNMNINCGIILDGNCDLFPISCISKLNVSKKEQNKVCFHTVRKKNNVKKMFFPYERRLCYLDN